MWLLLLLAIRGAAAGYCKDHNDNNVDWWVAYNPAKSDHALFLSSTMAAAKAKPISLDTWLGGRGKGKPGTPVWYTINSFEESARFMGYNDGKEVKVNGATPAAAAPTGAEGPAADAAPADTNEEAEYGVDKADGEGAEDGVDEEEEGEGAEDKGAPATGMEEEVDDEADGPEAGEGAEDKGAAATRVEPRKYPLGRGAHAKGRGAHAKGQVFADDESLVWMPHTCPEFFGTEESRDASSCHRNGQHFACYTMPTDSENDFIKMLFFANIKPLTKVDGEWEELMNLLLYGISEPTKSAPLQKKNLRGVRTQTFWTKGGLELNIAACGYYCEEAMSNTRLWIRPNRLHCRLYDRLAASPRYGGKKFLVRSWNREIDPEPRDLLTDAGLPMDRKMFPTHGSDTGNKLTEGSSARAGNVIESVGGWVLRSAKGEDDTGPAKEQLSWKRSRKDHAKFMVSTDETVSCLFDMNHYQARAGTSVCTENVDIARFWGTLIYPPKNLIITKPSDKWPALYYPEMSGFDLKKRTFGCPSSLDIDAKKSFFATSGSDVGKESGVAGVAQPPESIYSVCDATDRIDKRTPQVEAVTGRARVAEIPEGVNGYFPAPGADAPDAAAGAAAGADNIAPCVDVNTILGYATCNPSTVEEDAAFSRDAVTCNGVTERSPTLIDKCKPMSREDFFNHVGFVEGRGENGEDKKTLNGAYDKVINAKNGIKGIVFSKYTLVKAKLKDEYDGNCVNLRGGGRKVNRKRGRHPNLDSGGKDKERESEGSKPKRRGGGGNGESQVFEGSTPADSQLLRWLALYLGTPT